MCDFMLFLQKMSLRSPQDSVRFEKSSGKRLQERPNSVRFISQCEVWHVCKCHAMPI